MTDSQAVTVESKELLDRAKRIEDFCGNDSFCQFGPESQFYYRMKLTQPCGFPFVTDATNRLLSTAVALYSSLYLQIHQWQNLATNLRDAAEEYRNTDEAGAESMGAGSTGAGAKVTDTGEHKRAAPPPRYADIKVKPLDHWTQSQNDMGTVDSFWEEKDLKSVKDKYAADDKDAELAGGLGRADKRLDGAGSKDHFQGIIDELTKIQGGSYLDDATTDWDSASYAGCRENCHNLRKLGDGGDKLETFTQAWNDLGSLLRNSSARPFDPLFVHWTGKAADAATQALATQKGWCADMAVKCDELADKARNVTRAYQQALKDHPTDDGRGHANGELENDLKALDNIFDVYYCQRLNREITGAFVKNKCGSPGWARDAGCHFREWTSGNGYECMFFEAEYQGELNSRTNFEKRYEAIEDRSRTCLEKFRDNCQTGIENKNGTGTNNVEESTITPPATVFVPTGGGSTPPSFPNIPNIPSNAGGRGGVSPKSGMPTTPTMPTTPMMPAMPT
ncbi:MAG: hypothetical protein WCL11_28240, partial [Verrucomicrobiota bacterium]